jgi:23S rRNA (adenine2503-C2)-methyltransferase
MINLIGYPEEELKQLFADWGVPAYRVQQVFSWVYLHRVRKFEEMTNLSKDLRARLAEHFVITFPRIVARTHSQDGSIKYLFELNNGSQVESVWMPDETRKTLCISSQVGCRLACSFCLTATMGLKGNLTAGEIVGQCLAVNDDLPEKDQITNIVMMGMGEPLDNYEEVCGALRLMASPHAMRISNRKITLSTSGLVDRIRQFAQENIHVNLAISLNATEDATRNQIMPINKKYPINALMDCLKKYPLKPTRRITFEYVLLKGVNDSDEDAVRLGKLLSGVRSKINLIPFNGYEGSPYQPPSEERIKSFQNYLIQKKYSAFIRNNRGTDILGACGQLAAQAMTGSTAS